MSFHSLSSADKQRQRHPHSDGYPLLVLFCRRMLHAYLFFFCCRRLLLCCGLSLVFLKLLLHLLLVLLNLVLLSDISRSRSRSRLRIHLSLLLLREPPHPITPASRG